MWEVDTVTIMWEVDTVTIMWEVDTVTIMWEVATVTIMWYFIITKKLNHNNNYFDLGICVPTYYFLSWRCLSVCASRKRWKVAMSTCCVYY